MSAPSEQAFVQSLQQRPEARGQSTPRPSAGPAAGRRSSERQRGCGCGGQLRGERTGSSCGRQSILPTLRCRRVCSWACPSSSTGSRSHRGRRSKGSHPSRPCPSRRLHPRTRTPQQGLQRRLHPPRPPRRTAGRTLSVATVQRGRRSRPVRTELRHRSLLGRTAAGRLRRTSRVGGFSTGDHQRERRAEREREFGCSCDEGTGARGAVA